MLGLLKAQGEEIKELKELLSSRVKELADLKNIIKGMAKNILSTKDSSKKAESILFYLVLLYPSNRQTAPETNPNIASISSIPKSVVFSLQIALDLSQCKRKPIQKPFAKI